MGLRTGRVQRLRPANGIAYYVHILLVSILPLLVYVFVRMTFAPLAIALILLSKWRMFAVRPRYWPANIRSNAIDIMVGVSVVIFMGGTSSGSWQVGWALLYALWLLFLKPRSDPLSVSVQALAGQTAGLMALFIAWPDIPLVGLVAITWFVCYLAARQFFSSFDERYNGLYAHVWSYFGAALMWVLGHWLLFYGDVAQPTLLLTVLGFGLGAIYYLDETDRLSVLLRRQFVFIMVAIVAVVLVFSDWGDKTIK